MSEFTLLTGPQVISKFLIQGLHFRIHWFEARPMPFVVFSGILQRNNTAILGFLVPNQFSDSLFPGQA